MPPGLSPAVLALLAATGKGQGKGGPPRPARDTWCGCETPTCAGWRFHRAIDLKDPVCKDCKTQWRKVDVQHAAQIQNAASGKAEKAYKVEEEKEAATGTGSARNAASTYGRKKPSVRSAIPPALPPRDSAAILMTVHCWKMGHRGEPTRGEAGTFLIYLIYLLERIYFHRGSLQKGKRRSHHL